MAKGFKGLRSLQVLRSRKRDKRNEIHLEQKKMELRLKTELLHKLDVQFVTNDAVEIEVANPENIPMFMLVLDDESVRSLYDYEQVSESLYIFRPKQFM